MNIKFCIKVAVILISILFCSCRNSKQKLNTFSEYQKTVKSEVFDEFPIGVENFGNPYVLTMVNPSIIKRGYSGIFITYQYENEIEFSDKIDKHSKLAKHKIEIGGKESFIIPDSLDGKNGNGIPVPSLNDGLNFLNELVSTDDSSFLIFNYGKGNFFKPPFEIQSKEYSYQGFSNGCIVDEKNRYITYWTIVW